MRGVVAALVLAASLPAAAATLQTQYDAAQAAFDAGRMADARSGFAEILPHLDANPKMAATAAIVRARLGAATLDTNEPEAATAVLVRAIAALPAGSDDRQQAMLDLGHAHESALDYTEAASVYRSLLKSPDVAEPAQLGAEVGLARTLMFSAPTEARSNADAALALLRAAKGPHRADRIAEVMALRGRIEMNDGKPAEAVKWLRQAVASAGGLGTSINLADVRVRGDFALASFLSGDTDATRKYLAYSGAGLLPAQGFELGADMPLPGCAPTGPLARTDMAVVEFSLSEDGRVSGVTPIYVSRRGGPELAFARAVRTWSWRPEAAKRLPLFWRQAVRMELRCINNGSGRGIEGLGNDVRYWLAEHSSEPLPDRQGGDAAALPILESELQRRIALYGATSPQLLPVLLAIASNGVTSPVRQLQAEAQGLAIAKASDAPRELMLYFRIISAISTAAAEHARTARHYVASDSDPSPQLTALLAAFDAEGAGQTRGAALLLSDLARHAAFRGKSPKLEGYYRRVVAMPETTVPPGDPLRQTALLQLASLEAAASRIDAARALINQTGLTPDQCSAFPIEPVLAQGAGNSNDFPREAMEWHFEGTVRVAYDLDPQGRPVDVRTVIASPPLVFDEATEKLAARLRYQPIFRDGSAIACADLEKGVRYRIGGR